MEVPPFPSNLLNTSSRLLTDTLSSPPKRPNFERSESCNSFRHNADSHSDNCSSGIFNPDFSFKSKDIDDQFSNIEGLGIDRNNSSTSSISVYSSDASSSENEASESESDPKSSTNPFNDINQVNNFLTVRNDSLVDETFYSTRSSNSALDPFNDTCTTFWDSKSRSHSRRSSLKSVSSLSRKSSNSSDNFTSNSRLIHQSSNTLTFGLNGVPNLNISIPQDSLDLQDILTPTGFDAQQRSNVVSTCTSVDSDGTFTFSDKVGGSISRSNSLFKTAVNNSSTSSLFKSSDPFNTNDTSLSLAESLISFDRKTSFEKFRRRSRSFTSFNVDGPKEVCRPSISVSSFDDHIDSPVSFVAPLNSDYDWKDAFKRSENTLKNFKNRKTMLAEPSSGNTESFQSHTLETDINVRKKEKTKSLAPGFRPTNQKYRKPPVFGKIDTVQANKMYQDSKKPVQAVQTGHNSLKLSSSSTLANISNSKNPPYPKLRKSKSQGALRPPRKEMPEYNFASLRPLIKNNNLTLKPIEPIQARQQNLDQIAEAKNLHQNYRKPKITRSFSVSSDSISFNKLKAAGVGHHTSSMSSSHIDQIKNKFDMFGTRSDKVRHINANQTSSSLPSSPTVSHAQKNAGEISYDGSKFSSFSVIDSGLASQFESARLESHTLKDPLLNTPYAGRPCLETISTFAGNKASCQFIDVLSKYLSVY